MHGIKRSISFGSGSWEPASFGLVDTVKDSLGSSLKRFKSRLEVARTRSEPSSPSEARSTSPSATSSPSSSRRGSDASESTASSSNTSTPSSPPPSLNRRTPSPMTALHAEAVRIYQNPMGSIDLHSPSPPSPPARESTSIGLAPRRTPKQAAPVQECMVM
ncbi:hypothetical protein BCR35DRAFT_351264 [Leucosporidium creatinivorum]|uniref:Uncharacterized protein n=1 Tax=Leucosporidium creatinivorum TaxID=106004 RepID=A0A1Y2FX89_9BASI|nr:hypothetical protein BCR35DRAFT_351264 [Leucosporidium creatinivorum]